MYSIKERGHKAETKLISERKRRRSNLVIMWLSIWDVTVSIFFECWLMIQGLWETLKFSFNIDDRQAVRQWLREYLPQVPDNFAASWRDGLLLSTLLDRLKPGCCPERMDPSYALRNMYLVFQVLEYHFNISPKFTVEEIITCSNGSDAKLLDLLLQLKKEAETRTDEIEPVAHIDEREEKFCESSSSTDCVARGTGLMVGFVGRVANFIVFFASMSDLDLVVEIKGPCNTICTERITKRSPKKKQILKPWKPASQHEMVRSSSNEDKFFSHTRQASTTINNENETRHMPLEYEVHSNRIYFAYMPLIKGPHQIKILSQGMHVSDSPYAVAVGPVVRAHKSFEIGCLKSSIKVENDGLDHTETRKHSVRFQDFRERKERMGKIIKRRVLRYIVKIDNKDVVVDTDNIGNLATSLLKMDYDFQKQPLNRRNSWGFVGDAERKVSVIRQFCVNLDDLEAQSARLHRSHSFSSNINKSPSKSISGEYEDIEPKKLETVAEGTVSNFESYSLRNSEDLVYLNEDFENDTGCSKPESDKSLDEEDKHISEPESTRNAPEEFKENDIVKNRSLLSQLGAEASLIVKIEPDKFHRTQAIEKSPYHLTGASDRLGRVSRQIDNDEVFFSNNSVRIKDIDIKTSSTNGEQLTKEKEVQLNYAEKYVSLTQSLEDVNRKDNIGEKIHVPEELGIFESSLIYEKPFTKTVIKTLKNKREAMLTPVFKIKSSDEIDIENFEDGSVSNSFEHYQSLDPKPLLELKQDGFGRRSAVIDSVHEKQRFSTRQNKTHFPISKFHRKKTNYQKHTDQISLNMPSSDHIRKNNSNVIPGNSYKLQPKNTRTSEKIEKVSSSFICNNSPANNCERNSFVKDIKSFHFQRNHSTYLMNKLKDDNEPNQCGTEIYEITKKKASKQFDTNSKSNRNEQYSPNVNFKNRMSSTNSVTDESGIEITSPNLTHSFMSENCPTISQMFTNNTLGRLHQLNFRPTFPITRKSLVKSRIEQWEKTVNREDSTSESSSNSLTSKSIDITSKLKFWETATNENKLNQEFQKKTIAVKAKWHDGEDDLTDTPQMSSTSMKIRSRRYASPSTPSTTNSKQSLPPTSNKSLTTLQKYVLEDKFTAILPFHKRGRSVSDPGILEQTVQISSYFNQKESKRTTSNNAKTRLPKENSHLSPSPESPVQIKQTSSVEYASSGSLFEKCTDDDEDDSSADLLDSTEDEYIDDEISESVSTYWGDLSVMERLKVADTNDYRDLRRIVDADAWRYRKDGVQTSPVDCQVFGIATYFGYVAVKNRFQVLTKGAGSGNLSATLQGFGHHHVTYVSVRYTKRDVYEVTYQVMSPGLYLISVRWMENPIAGSPFLCKVTF